MSSKKFKALALLTWDGPIYEKLTALGNATTARLVVYYKFN
jgi:hypothetical protein